MSKKTSTPPTSLSDPRVIKRAESIPDEITFVDENDVPWDDMEPMELGEQDKLLIAFQMVRSKQSIQTVFERALRAGIRKAMKAHPEAFADLE